ncbi:MAG: putative ABC transporter permease [Ruminococcus sp.]|nr:putative ABC transporter permease [Ruminococcus sp.]
MKKEKRTILTELIWLFVIGCLFGFILETIWYYIKNGLWINKQGLLYGPFKPIYGLGLVLIVLFMDKYRNKNIIFKYVLGVFIGSAFEYFGSLFQEYVFHTSTWSYANFNLNLSGRLYLPYCLIWGIVAIIAIDYIVPFFRKITSKIPRRVGQILTIIISIFMIINISLTILATIRYSGRSNNGPSNNPVFKVIDSVYNDEYMQHKFPKLKIISSK